MLKNWLPNESKNLRVKVLGEGKIFKQRTQGPRQGLPDIALPGSYDHQPIEARDDNYQVPPA